MSMLSGSSSGHHGTETSPSDSHPCGWIGTPYFSSVASRNASVARFPNCRPPTIAPSRTLNVPTGTNRGETSSRSFSSMSEQKTRSSRRSRLPNSGSDAGRPSHVITKYPLHTLCAGNHSPATHTLDPPVTLKRLQTAKSPRRQRHPCHVSTSGIHPTPGHNATPTGCPDVVGRLGLTPPATTRHL